MPELKDLSKTKKAEETAFYECKTHCDIGFDETDKRATGRNRIGSISFNEADELFRSWIDENKWPYDALIFDPRIFTFIFEKTSRLIANKPKGRLIPREGSDILSAKINNALLDYQWDTANIGGSMISKWAMMDMNTRKYGASFALCKWRYETDDEGEVVFDGPDMQVLNNRDIAHDLTATSIESCNWFQVRQYVTIQDLKRVNDHTRSAPVYKNLDKLEYAIKTAEEGRSGGDGRDTNWISRNREIAGLETDPYGKDPAFKTIEIVTEYRKDRWITFAPKHGIVIRDIPNPYKNHEIPIVMLRYYSIDDDLYGISEIEPVKGLQKGINAILCQYLDEINQQLYTPVAIGPGVRQHTLEWAKGARWIMNNPMSDFRLVESRSNAAQYFNNTYSMLVSAMMNSLGESSLGVSNIQPYQKDKTATEVKALQLQRNARDNHNQIFLAEAIKRQYLLWHTMNQKLLFSDPEKQYFIMRIVGSDTIEKFQKEKLDSKEDLLIESQKLLEENIEKFRKTGEADDMSAVQEAMKDIPAYRVNVGTKDEPDYHAKLEVDDDDQSALLIVEPEDIKGSFNFSIDVESMTANADDERKAARQSAITLLTSNPNVMQMLIQEGVKPKFKDLFVTWLEDLGFNDADRYFEKAPEASSPSAPSPEQMMSQIQGAAAGGASEAPQGGSPTGIPGGTNPNIGGENQSQSPFGSQQGLNTQTLSPESLQKFFDR